jgi:hypothetical protein
MAWLLYVSVISGRNISYGVEDDVYDVCGRGDQRRVVDRA